MVLLTTTPQILSVLSSLPPSTISTLSKTTPLSSPTATPSTPPTNDPSSKETTHLPLPTTLTTPISHSSLIALSHLRRSHPEIPPLNTLLIGTHPYKPPTAPQPPKSPEYIALMTRLRLEQEQREYERLLAQQHAAGAKPVYEDEDPISPSLVLNILLSVVMCAIAVFAVTKWYASDAVRVLLSLGAAVVVGLAEVGVYSIYVVKVGKARRRERAVKERKTVIGPVVVVEEKDEGVRVGEKEEEEEIWGRGVNGGVRRRVREKWEKEQENVKI